MDKEEQFLWIVQTMVITNAVNLASQSELANTFRDEISATGAFIVMDEAVRASQLIPEGMSAAEAANQFCTYMLRSEQEPEERANGGRATLPAWFARM